ncbi:hypothetical protein CcaverHIS002_0701100 [Cutaneotrichosporon cavernicola]|uniref:Uncharacterized protein n=1 Tax=Cutaneotrichosporon cavernicola TaxID=279322 RepID=A0AA48L9R6_9TREE|nr:uncharacterized protein CcaverHIS019_0701110 [Cutaneotrichosporon cavernicola]BEI86764.1 hypothetical protein CcaverHIS002_0701100 [Cutaneotrichosporon cavernicola]BEI94539.1 hypothetical protein CcaverHIS019_0701110 [Cutaneotrichosporon cavernicola]BEJ02315.1 hypothetical protein CcaverHIS631_0701100 [Cutaneotrichosporon cavernicola]BEJ10074.1 hypothetical protein CcaverHIS641_0701090 [Cutaneotrichosporon cavernicola]
MATTSARPLAVPTKPSQLLHPSSAGSPHLPPPTPSYHSASSLGSHDTMDTLELTPGVGLGPFSLGDSLWHVLDLLRSRKTEAPKVDVSWDPDNSPTTSVTVHAGPLALLFPSPAQRLAHIVVTDLADVTLTYEGTVLSSPTCAFTRAGVAYALGPTFSDGTQRLAYPGLVLEAAGGDRDDRVTSVSIMARDGEEPVGEDGLRRCSIKPGHGATLTFAHDVNIMLGETTAQDVLLDLGPPLRKYWREDDRLDRVWGPPRRVPPGHDATSPSACFWNYLQYGLDLLVVDGIVTKLVAYSNIPGTPMFQQYARCPWEVETGDNPLDLTAPLSSFRIELGSAPLAANGESPAPKQKKKKGGETADTDPPAPDSDAMVLDRSVEGGLEGVVGLSRSQLVGFDGLVLEVDEGSGGIASVQIFRAGV